MDYITKINLNGTDYDVGADASALVSEALEAAYPVGAIYLSFGSSAPSELFGGTWEAIEDTFLLAAGSTYTAGATGGAATVSLTTSTMPSHTHTATATGSVTSTFTGTAASHTHTYNQWTKYDDKTDDGSGATGSSSSNDASSTTGSTSITPKGTVTSTFTGSSVTTGSAGSSSVTAHNNMPPYIAVNAWRRTA